MSEPVDLAKSLPCWSGEVDPQPLSGGISNYNFVVEDAGQKYVVRIGGDQPMHNVLRFNEQSIGRSAATLGITPPQVYAQADALVIGFVEGVTYGPEQVQENLERLLPTVRRLHTEGLSAVRGPVLAFSPFHVVRHYAKLLNEGACRMLTELPRLLRISAELEVAAGAIDLALCHNDLLAANFIDDGDRIWLVDWEHAGFGSPLFDLANIASNSLFSEDLERRMLALYFGTAVDAGLWRRFLALRTVSHLRESMWSMIAELYSQLDEDYVAYTATNLAAFENAHERFCKL